MSNQNLGHSKPLTQTPPILPPQGMSRAKDILPLLPFSRTTLHEWSRDGRFPQSIHLSANMVAWKNADVLQWLENHNSNPTDIP